MPELPEWQRAMASNVDDKMLRDIVRENRRGVSGPSSVIPDVEHASKTTTPVSQSRNGWVDPPPLRPQWGFDWADRQRAIQERIAAREAAKRDEGQD
jgi:hypothetical protein